MKLIYRLEKGVFSIQNPRTIPVLDHSPDFLGKRFCSEIALEKPIISGYLRLFQGLFLEKISNLKPGKMIGNGYIQKSQEST